MNPYQINREFEAALAEYCGSPFCITVTSCTTALMLALKYWLLGREGQQTIEIPKRTYIGVAMAVLNSGAKVAFRDEQWSGEYRLSPTPIWDSARRMREGMYRPGMMQTLSFHWTKHLAIGQGGCILHDDEQAQEYFRRARFDGRREGVPAVDDEPDFAGVHAYLMPRDAAEGLTRLAVLPKDNPDIPWDEYADLSQWELFK